MCSEQFDHTSNLMFLEKITGVKCPNISDWRRKIFGDFTSVFRFGGKPAGPPAMPDTTGDFYRSEYEVATLARPCRAGSAAGTSGPGPRPAAVTPRGRS